MCEFFHGWRRRVGCVLLVVACTLFGMWARSRVVIDRIEIHPNDTSTLSVQFDLDAIAFEHRWNESYDPPRALPPEFFKVTSNRIYGTQPLDILFSYQRGGYVEGSSHGGTMSRGYFRSLEVPYLTSVLILVMLSAYLILWKPRKAASVAKWLGSDPINCAKSDPANATPRS